MSLAYSEDNNKKNFFGLMDNARSYELHLKQLEGIYKQNKLKKLEGFNTLNSRILRTRNINRKFVRDDQMKEVQTENQKFLGNLKKINTRKTQFPKYNYQMPTGVLRYNYSDSKSRQTFSRKTDRSGKSIQSQNSFRSANSKQSKNSKAISRVSSVQSKEGRSKTL